MLPWSFKKWRKGQSTSVGIAIGANTLTMVACDGEVEGRPRIVAWDSARADDPASRLAALQHFVAENGLENQPCRCVLSPNDYSLRLVERPANVPDDELVDATRWLVRELIEFDIDGAEIAILTVPEDRSRARTPRMFVVAAREEAVQDLAQLVTGAGLDLAGLEIVESAMLSIEARMTQVVAGSAVLRVDDKSSTLTIAFENDLYLARSLSIDAYSIEAAASQALENDSPNDPEVQALLDPLLLEIQRSLDYYESEYGGAPASRLTFLPSTADFSPIIPAMSETLRPLSVEGFELDRHFELAELPLASVQAELVIAAGAATADPDRIGTALVPARFRPPEGGFGLGSVLKIAAAMAVLAALFSIVDTVRLRADREILSALESERDRISAERDVIEEARIVKAANKLDPNAQVNALRAERDARMLVLRDLQQGRSTTNASFSNLLEALARQDLANVWLERIELDEGGDAVTLEGRALRAEDVPNFLRRLGREGAYEDRHFRKLQIEPPDDALTALFFRISTLDPDSDTPGGG